MTSLAEYLEAHRLAFAEINGLVAGLDADQLAVQSLCPEWDVRACLGHVMGVEKALTGWTPDPDSLFDFGLALEFAAGLDGLSAPEVASAVHEVTVARTADLESRDPSVVDAPSMTPVGPQAYGNFLQIRVFDMWVHARDIALPLGVELPDGGPTADMALNEVHRSMGYIAGKKIGLEDGMSMTFEITGGAPRTIHVVVDGRAGLVDTLEAADVTVTADVETFVMLACGRVDPQQRIDAGRIAWTGDDAWGDKAARNLRFTM